MKEIYVGFPEKAPNFDSIYKALLSLDACPASQDEEALTRSFSEKEYPAKKSDLEPVTIHLAKGVYHEKLVITRPNLTLTGEGADTVIEFGHGAFEDMEDGTKRGTFRTASVRIDTHDFTAKNITFKNTAGWGDVAGQALALYVDGDRNVFENCYFTASQDTIFTAPLPLKEAQPGGFRGPGEFNPRIMGRQLYKNCVITGDVDFIFGSAVCIFDKCTLFSKRPENRPAPLPGEPTPVYGYVTAASTPENEPFGYVFFDCKFESDCPKGTVYLGRPWREYAKTVLINCEIGDHINPLGWQDWGKDHSHFFYAEYNCSGAGSDTSGRASFSHVLTDEEASKYTYSNIFGDWIV